MTAWQDAVVTRLAERGAVERTSALVAAGSVGGTFSPGLLPRGTLDQAIATGVVAAVNYGLVSTSQSLVQGVAHRIVPGMDETSRLAAHVLAATANGVVIAAGTAIGRSLPQRRGEPVRRAFVRTAAFRVAKGAAGGLVVTAAIAAGDVAAQRWGRAAKAAMLPTGIVVGTVMSAQQVARYQWAARDAANALPPAVDPLPLTERERWEVAETAGLPLTAVAPSPSSPVSAPRPPREPAASPGLPPAVRSVALGVVVSGGLFALAGVETLFARGVAAVVRRVVPGLAPVAPAIGHLTALSGVVAGGAVGVEYLNRSSEQGGAAIEAAYETAPPAPTVSGGPESVVDWRTLSREGARFVNMVLPANEIAAVTGADVVTTPIRAFVGLDAAPTVDQRVDLVMTDLERTGAFERSVICLASPTGSGYVNYVAIETLEYLTRGDCATVAMQYSLRPSFLSLDRVAMGREQNRALLHALTWRLRAIPADRRPRVVGLGESLGAHTLQDAFLHEGAPGFRRVGMDRALFLGTPAGSGWAADWRLSPDRYDPDGEVVELASYQEWLDLPDDVRARSRYVLLSHHEDPITKFEPALLVQQPDWLGPLGNRPPGVPRDAAFRPLTTFVLTLVDVKNAMDVEPGYFVARGHDYRADIARMVSVAFALPVADDELRRIEDALRRRELAWAEQRLYAEQFAQARESVARQLRAWGLSEGGAASPSRDPSSLPGPTVPLPAATN